MEKPRTLSNAVLYLMSISAGLVAANLYYNQPLLHLISMSFEVSESAVSNVALATQLGYAFGLLFVVPLGDMVNNHKILKLDFILMLLSLVAAGFAPSLWFLVIASFFIGCTSALPQLFVPMAAQLSNAENRGRAIGIVMSGLLIGILGSRAISGFVGEQFGWRSMYFVATLIMLILFIVLKFKLPKIEPIYKGSYADLMTSLLHYFKSEPPLRLAAVRGGLSFAGLSAFWTTLVFLMEDNFGYGSGITGTFGLIGVVGALAASIVGKLSDRISKNLIIITSTVILILSWSIFMISAHSIIGIVLGVVFVDLGQQSLHIANQNIIFSRNESARNRINTIYMVIFFLGGALGTTLGAYAWQHYQWIGVSVLGLSLSILSLIAHLIYGDKKM
ncbi:MFS transporter [Zobellia galactanivorans]|uniref:MFS transporter n=1 Tax=Zobellia galactanivorans (strain DSM 12802 / CCUG 47099 / CIP 106680 / NCIMB 13871 / Dsij) TaxID=63186 RepID=UPI001C070D33|nr:MFS transporter [Zobellia galactanivorans]MBU3026635.1 MFS transporter [Zobellia galactanivorans]MDO6809225.1 MFS transporter [Zobellia galactanivorans]